jgi:hypothetical protein
MVDLLVNNQSGPVVTLTEWEEVVCSCVPPPGATLTLVIAGFAETTPLSPFLTPGDPSWHWRWNPRNATGQFKALLTIRWPDGRVVHRQTILDVLPRKIDRQQYDHLLRDLQRTARALLSTLLAKGTVGATLESSASLPPSDHRYLLEACWWLFDERFPAFERAVQQIVRHPHLQGTPLRERVPSGQARDFSHAAPELSRGPHIPTGEGNPPVPAEVTHTRTVMSFDTDENRLLKQVLREAWQRAMAMARLTAPAASGAAGRQQRRMMPEHAVLHERSRSVAHRLETLRSLPWFAQVGPLAPGTFREPGQVIRRNPAYRRVYRFWRDLRRIPWITTTTLDHHLLHLPLHELPRLYECWCAVQVAHALLNLPGANVAHHRLIAPPPDPLAPTGFPLTLTLAEEAPLLVLDWRGRTLSLRYQPRYRPVQDRPDSEPETIGSLDCHTHIPDLSLEVRSAGLGTGHSPDAAVLVLVFDAKYRLTAGGGVPDDALADAYTYLGSLGLPSGQRVTRCSAVLYPGTTSPRWFPSGTALLPLLPGSTAYLEDIEGELERLLSASGLTPS